MLKFKCLVFLCSLWAFNLSSDTKKCESTFNTSNLWMSFEDAKAFIQSEIQSGRVPRSIFGAIFPDQPTHKSVAFEVWSNSDLRPKNFPKHPDKVYADEWKGWADFFDLPTFEGSNNIVQIREFRTDQNPSNLVHDRPPNRTLVDRDNTSALLMSFEDAKALIQSERITRSFMGGIFPDQPISNSVVFEEWSNSDLRPKNFPKHPDKAYEEDWKGWADFLGLPTYEGYKNFVQSRGIRTDQDYRNVVEGTGPNLTPVDKD